MKISISARATAPSSTSSLAKLRKTVQDLTEKLNAARAELAAAQKVEDQKAAVDKKAKDTASVKAHGKVSFVVKSSTGREATFTKFGEALAALTKSSWRNGKPCTLTAVTKTGEDLLAKKTQTKGADKPLAKVYFTTKGRVFKNAAGI